ncbi:MAG TPA: dNTP triphosphohydrolase [Phycisphaerae bacterium]|nr:dNTP triphosphohydrolase [Phycisphaerae bacterium]
MSRPKEPLDRSGDAELAAYALPSRCCGGREHPDRWADDESEGGALAVDRHRVVHSAAFRRLQYKTQVFLTSEGDHFRTRLTHTLEVAHVARRLCRRLGLNADLAEVIALVHDLGHSPFGHAGEAALNELMKEHGGFDHNGHSLRVVEYLEHPYPSFRGLNMTLHVRQAVARHRSRYDRPCDHPLADGRYGPLEGQVASLADRLAYDMHDLEDAIGAGLVSGDQLALIDLWREAIEPLRAEFSGLSTAAVRRPVLDRIADALLDDVTEHTRRHIDVLGIAGLGDVEAAVEPIVGSGSERARQWNQIETFLRDRVYLHDRLTRMDAQARRWVAALFEAYAGRPRLLPDRFAGRIDDQGVYRVVCDYVAGMTDRFCQDECRRLFEPAEGT